jgi:hypothetical protein
MAKASNVATSQSVNGNPVSCVRGRYRYLGICGREHVCGMFANASGCARYKAILGVGKLRVLRNVISFAKTREKNLYFLV